MNFRNFKLGWEKDRYDSRDYTIYRYIKPIELPTKVDLREYCSPVRSQGSAGTCVGHATAMMEDSQERKEYGTDIVTSPRFIYAECKTRDGIPNTEGTYIKIAMQVVNELGVCNEESCRYSMATYKTLCPDDCYNEALAYKDKEYARLNSIEDMKQCLYQIGAIVIGIPIYTSFYLTTSNGKIPVPDPSHERLYGGHALCVAGYDDEKQHFILRNSWGPYWGDKGDGYLPYEFLEVIGSGGYDAWKSVDITTSPDPPEPVTKFGLRVQIKQEGEWETIWEKEF